MIFSLGFEKCDQKNEDNCLFKLMSTKLGKFIIDIKDAVVKHLKENVTNYSSQVKGTNWNDYLESIMNSNFRGDLIILKVISIVYQLNILIYSNDQIITLSNGDESLKPICIFHWETNNFQTIEKIKKL